MGPVFEPLSSWVILPFFFQHAEIKKLNMPIEVNGRLMHWVQNVFPIIPIRYRMPHFANVVSTLKLS